MTLDRTGEPIEPDEHDCQGGWIDRDADPAVPCLACKPWLTPAVRHRRAHGIDADHTRTEEINR
jgi:hypothetical protein